MLVVNKFYDQRTFQNFILQYILSSLAYQFDKISLKIKQISTAYDLVSICLELMPALTFEQAYGTKLLFSSYCRVISSV